MSTKDKKVKREKLVTGAKIPKNKENPDTYLDKTPVWVFRRCDRESEKWNICECENFKRDILEKLMSFEGMTWGEIQKASGGRQHGTNHHYIKLCDMTKQAQERALAIRLDVDELFSLRLTGTKRLYGIINNGVYQMIWYTDEHDICLSEKKNT